jgi:hypothetical protein
VEPNYEKKLETFDDLLHSEVVYGYHPFVNFAQHTLSYPQFLTFFEHKTLTEDCSDVRKCVERMITKRDIASFTATFFAIYVSREMGIENVGKAVCSFDEALISVGLTVLFKKGNPLLDRFNILMRHYLENGLLEKVWTELQHRASIRGGGRLREAAGDMFFAFSVSHIMPAFVTLLVGTVLSSMVFIGELIVNCLCKRREKKIVRVTRVRLLY